MDSSWYISLIEVGGVIGTLLGSLIWFYRKTVRPMVRYFNKLAACMEDHGQLIKNVETIKKEITTNGGSSIKDAINRIEKRQLIIDERTRAMFYGKDKPIFEIDNVGNIQWGNKAFHKLMGHKNLSGLDWVSLVDEPDRKGFLSELASCGATGRELNYEVHTDEGQAVLYGFPFKDKKVNQNYGFLVYILYQEIT